MKKSLFTLIIISFVITIFSCASKPKKLQVVSNDVTFEDLPEEEKAQILKKQAEEELFNLDWIKKQNKNLDLAFGNVRLKARKNNGTFNILVLNDLKKAIPVLQTSNEYNTSSAYLKVGKRVIKLNQDSYIKTYTRKKDDGMQIAYIIDGLSTVIIDFTCFSSDPDYKDVDTVKITTAVKNTSKKKESFELKYILDTVLGETDRHHFYGPNAEPIKNEVVITDMDEYKWFVSKNSKASVVFNFEGLEAVKPAIIALSNYNTLNTTTWRPETSVSRAFGTVLSYNNSAVGVLYKPQKLSPNEYFTQTFYLTLSTQEGQTTENPLIKDSKNENKTEKKQSKITQKTNQPTKNTLVEEENQPAKQTVKNDKKTSEKEKNKSNKKDKKYSEKYIKELLEKIANLKDTQDISSDELKRLNDELDEIMKEMRN